MEKKMEYEMQTVSVGVLECRSLSNFYHDFELFFEVHCTITLQILYDGNVGEPFRLLILNPERCVH